MRIPFGEATRLLVVVAILLAFSNNAFTDNKARPAPLNWQPLTLKGGWAPYGVDTREPQVAIDSNNIVHLRGAIAGGMEGFTLFKLPSAYRPGATLYIPVSLNAYFTGRLSIYADGHAQIDAEDFAQAQNLLSLENVTFPKDGASAQ